MKPKFLRRTALLLVSLLLLLPSGMGITAFAAGDADTIAAGETKTVSVPDDGTDALLRFTPTQSGYYALSFSNLANFFELSLLDGADKELANTFINTMFGETELIIRYEAGESYTYAISLGFIIIDPPQPITEDVTVSLTFLGELESVTMRKAPKQLTYIQGMDTQSMEEYLAEMGYSSLEEVLNDPEVSDGWKDYVRENQNGWIYFNDTGIVVEAVFSGGVTKVYNDRSAVSTKLKNPLQIGENILVLTYGGGIRIELAVTVIENPVESIEIIYMPEITPIYLDWIDFGLGNAALDKYLTEMPPYGTQIQINYTDGTSKVITVDATTDLYDIDGYPMYVYYYTPEDIEDGNRIVFELEYLNSYTTYEIPFEFSDSLSQVLSILTRVFSILFMVIDILTQISGISIF